MTEKELKKLNRYQLLELLLLQAKRVQELEKQLEETQKVAEKQLEEAQKSAEKQLEEAQKELDIRDIKLENIGSIAEASVQLSGVLEATQNAADLYLNAAKGRAVRLKEEAKEEAKKEAEKILKDARRTAQRIIESAEKRAGRL